MTRPETQRPKGRELTENEIGSILVDAGLEIHRQLGPGLLESVYEVVMEYELSKRGLVVARQVPIAIVYKGLVFDEGFRADLVVANKVIVELKSVEQINNAHRKQIQSYLHLTGLKLGFIFNFGAALMRDGIVRAVNGLDPRYTHRSPGDNAQPEGGE
jgi:GxxExxY protein